MASNDTTFRTPSARYMRDLGLQVRRAEDAGNDLRAWMLINKADDILDACSIYQRSKLADAYCVGRWS